MGGGCAERVHDHRHDHTSSGMAAFLPVHYHDQLKGSTIEYVLIAKSLAES